jgi:tetratricopeptide (TPR) repeat protein
MSPPATPSPSQLHSGTAVTNDTPSIRLLAIAKRMRDHPALLTLAASLLGALLIYLLWQFMIVPRRRRLPLLRAIKIIDNDEARFFEDAENLIRQTLASGLRGNDVIEAQFALAYVRARLGKFAEAESVLSDLRADGHVTPHTRYLEMWTATKRKDYAKVERVYEEAPKQVVDLLQARLMAAIAYSNRAQHHWENKEIASATHYWKLIRELGELVHTIPTEVEDHQVMLGVQELFQKNFEAAREHFKAAASSEGANKDIKLKAEIGTILSAWLATPEQRGMLLDTLDQLTIELTEQLGAVSTAIARSFCTECGADNLVRAEDNGRRVICKSCARYFVVEGVEPVELEDEALPVRLTDNEDTSLLRNLLVWSLNALLHRWLDLPVAHSPSNDDWSELTYRARRLRDVDEESSHADLIEGLIHYYLGYNDETHRERGVELIKASVEHGVNLAEVHSLLDAETRRAERRSRAAEQLLDHIRGYLTNEQVPAAIRTEVRDTLSRYGARYDELIGDAEIRTGEIDNAPTARDLGARLKGMNMRLRTFEQSHPKAVEAYLEKVHKSQKALIDVGEALQENARRFEHYEGDVLSVVGQMLLKEEE